MITKIYKIKRNQYLTDIEPFKTSGIPSNVFLFKTITGCGATELELTFHRHSIIVEPNVPVIKGKIGVDRHKGKLLGIYEGVTIQKILNYLEGTIKYKKILVTPESFGRLKEAVDQSELNFYNDFFLLFDECEKAIQDVHYRGSIISPMDDFFQFEKKAVVSATPILPSDPRFQQQNFSIVEIVPRYDYSQKLTLIPTNNIFITIKSFVEKNPRDKYFIFFNSTDNIADLVKKMKWENDSMIFCAKESKKKLSENGFKSVSTEIKTFKKFNLFTSRFNSAVDILYPMFECNPTVIMVTDLIFALHTKIDPLTEAIQIPGRFREPKNKKIKREIVHIFNVDPSLTSMSKPEVEIYLRDCHNVYKMVDRYYESATTIAARMVLQQMLERIDYARFINPIDKSKNHYMVDNMVVDEKVKGYYQTPENLIGAYRDSKHFQLPRDITSENYQYTDLDRKKARAKNVPLKSLNKIVSEKLINLYRTKSNVTEFAFEMEITNMQFDYPDQMAPINRYGLEKSYKLNFNIQAIEEQLQKEKDKNDMFGMMTYIQRNFIVGQAYESNSIESILKKGFKECKIFGVRPSLEYLRKYAEISGHNERVRIRIDEDGKEIKGYLIKKFLDLPF